MWGIGKLRAAALALLALSCLSQRLVADDGNQFTLGLTPASLVPFERSPRYFTTGGGIGVALDYRFPIVSWLGVRLALDGTYLPIWTGDGCAIFSAGAGPSLHLPSLGAFKASLYGLAGYYYGVIADSANLSGGNLFAAGGLRAGWAVTPSIDLGLDVSYRLAADGEGGLLFQGLNAGLGARFTFLRAGSLDIRDIRFDDVFPVLYKFYDTHPVGTVSIENRGSAPFKDVEVSLFIDKYMDNPTTCPAPSVLPGGKKATLDLYALLSEKVQAITESTVVSARVRVSYTQESRRLTAEKAASLRLHDRNAITWDDDRKVAAFVMNKDPAILEIAKTMARIVKSSPPALDANLGTAIALHEALRTHGLSYVVDPTSSYAEKSEDGTVVDYIQYPRATLQYRTGDCDDLAVLSAAILQGVGIDTAFITVPGHIYLAFALKMSAGQARRLFSDPSSLIVRGETAWIPVEITHTRSPFIEAWETGAAEWRENGAAAALVPVAEAWQIYAPIGVTEDSRMISFPAEPTVAAAYTTELARWTDRELASHASRIERSGGGRATGLNALGVIHAQFGRMASARELFGQALQQEAFFPAIVNLANALSLEGQYGKALAQYLRAQGQKPNDAPLMLHVARTYDRLGDARNAEAWYLRLKARDPDLAARHGYLAGASGAEGRAAETASERETIQWLE